MSSINSILEEVTAEIRHRSQATRRDYLQRMQRSRDEDPPRRVLSCGNLAHGYAACGEQDKQTIRMMQSVHLGIINAYNDVIAAHEPMEGYPETIRSIAREMGCSAQMAGGVPAMCDGVTQGRTGMELSLFSRDVIAMATAVSLSHNLFDGFICLGTCDKIVPGLMIGALQFGHLAAAFLPAGPMRSGIPNKEKANVRQRYAEGKATREELLEVESASYHSPGTCTFYGTANSNQVMMEMMGVQLPGCSFINPDDPLRQAMIRETVLRLIPAADPDSKEFKPLTRLVTEESIVNALVGLLATGGSTNHTLHLVAMARSAGIHLRWEDFDRLSRVVPLIARVYPNGDEDVNAFRRAGGMAFLVRELRGAGLLNENVLTLMGEGMEAYEFEPAPGENGRVAWRDRVMESRFREVLRPVSEAFNQEGGLRLLNGNIGQGIIKISAVKPEQRKTTAPAVIFHSQAELKEAFERGDLNRDFVAVVRFQGAKANGMPELHHLTPFLGVLQDRGHSVALLTDGRMSGASGKVPAAIHVSPEAVEGGPIARLRDGDLITIDADEGTMEVHLDEGVLATRSPALHHQDNGTMGRPLFQAFREHASTANRGCTVF
ncbi:phosphogluconate dehydratase [Gilvimarinus sp. F26214L]|uniref:phosphogluconate dehydratase n=1 Tax=Gilvimarinus sp. DZF01 TaxID=3461371 RepID=UPI00404609D0